MREIGRERKAGTGWPGVSYTPAACKQATLDGGAGAVLGDVPGRHGEGGGRPAPQANDQGRVEELCAAGARVTGAHMRGDTILHWACGLRSKYAPCTRAPPMVVHHCTLAPPWHQCTTTRCGSDLLQLLWQLGADLGAVNDGGATPLRIAIRCLGALVGSQARSAGTTSW